MSKKIRKEIQNEWAKPKSSDFRFDLIAEYSNYVGSDQSNQLSEKTLVDLDFNKFFSVIDRTQSIVSQQYLYHKLICQTLDSKKLEEQESLIEHYNSSKKASIIKHLLLTTKSRQVL